MRISGASSWLTEWMTNLLATASLGAIHKWLLFYFRGGEGSKIYKNLMTDKCKKVVTYEEGREGGGQNGKNNLWRHVWMALYPMQLNPILLFWKAMVTRCQNLTAVKSDIFNSVARP